MQHRRKKVAHAAVAVAAIAAHQSKKVPYLPSYDWIVVNTSAGKDSQAMLDYIVELADAQGVDRKRIVAVHCDLGRVEWAGTRELAERQAKHYAGVRFEVVSRAEAPKGDRSDLLDHVAKRGMWPGFQSRYCTSDHKRGQVNRLLTALAKQTRAARPWNPRARILNCLGLRAQESPAREKAANFEHEKRNTNSRRHVDRWLPIQSWTTDQVWERIRQSGVEHHQAYDLGMSRLSCVFCIYAPRDALLLAGEHNPELLDQYVEVEKNIKHTFREDQTLVEIKSALARGERSQGTDDGTWNDCPGV